MRPETASSSSAQLISELQDNPEACILLVNISVGDSPLHTREVCLSFSLELCLWFDLILTFGPLPDRPSGLETVSPPDRREARRKSERGGDQQPCGTPHERLFTPRSPHTTLFGPQSLPSPAQSLGASHHEHPL